MTDKAYCVIEMLTGTVTIMSEKTLLGSVTTTHHAAAVLRTFVKSAKVGELLWVRGLVVVRMLEADALYRTEDPNGPNAMPTGEGGDHRLRKDNEVFAFDAKRFTEVQTDAMRDLIAAVRPYADDEKGLGPFLLMWASAGLLGQARANQILQHGSVPILIDDACRSFAAAIDFWERLYLETEGKKGAS